MIWPPPRENVNFQDNSREKVRACAIKTGLIPLLNVLDSKQQWILIPPTLSRSSEASLWACIWVGTIPLEAASSLRSTLASARARLRSSSNLLACRGCMKVAVVKMHLHEMSTKICISTYTRIFSPSRQNTPFFLSLSFCYNLFISICVCKPMQQRQPGFAWDYRYLWGAVVSTTLQPLFLQIISG